MNLTALWLKIKTISFLSLIYTGYLLKVTCGNERSKDTNETINKVF